MTPKKPGGGNKPQPYIPAGNGNRSGEYTNDTKVKIVDSNGKYLYIPGKYNLLHSKHVKKVYNIYKIGGKHPEISLKGKPNSVLKRIENGYLKLERYYDENGYVYLDIHYTNHGRPKTHKVPHIHLMIYDGKKLERINLEEFE